MSKKLPKTKGGTGLARVAGYYVVVAVLVGVLVTFVPFVREIVSGGRLQELGGELTRALGAEGPPAVGSAIPSEPFLPALLALASILGALAIMVPVTWVYMLTRRQRGYDESVVHTLLILPVTVTGIVMIVQNSVALAFSLAGIVAAVRFRTTLEDTKDAVYVFLAIGVGLACGVQAIGIALVLSLVFNGVVLALWKTRFGNIYADRNTRVGPLSLGDVLAGPGSHAAALSVGDPAVLEAANPVDLAEIADRAVRIERHLSEERTRKKTKRANALLLVHAGGAQAAQTFVEPILEELSVRWKLAEMEATSDGFILQYLARLDGPGVQGAVMDRLREAPAEAVAAAELRSLRGLKARA